MTSQNNLAYAYESAGDLKRAIPLYEATLADRERVLGSDYPDVLTSRNNLAGTYGAVGDLAVLPWEVANVETRDRMILA